VNHVQINNLKHSQTFSATQSYKLTEYLRGKLQDIFTDTKTIV